MIATSGRRTAVANRRFDCKKYLQLLTAALPRIIDKLADQGYEFVTLPSA